MKDSSSVLFPYSLLFYISTSKLSCRNIRLALGVADDVTSDDGADDSDNVNSIQNAVEGFSCLSGMDPRVAP